MLRRRTGNMTYSYLKEAVKKRPLLIAVLLNSIWLVLTACLCDIKYQISDDFVIASIFSGGYGAYISLAPYVNVCLGKILKIFYNLIPNVSWFFIYIIALEALSLAGLTYVFLKKNGIVYGLCFTALLYVFFTDDLYVLPTYTEAAAVACIAGGILILHALEREKEIFLMTWISGSELLVGGGLLRKESLVLSLPFLGIFFVRHAVCIFQSKAVKNGQQIAGRIFRSFAFCMMPLFLLAGAQWIDHIQWNRTDSGAQYTKFDKLRISVTDTAGYGYASVKQQYEELGLDETDYKMVNSWILMDQDIYTEDVLREIASIKKEIRDEKAHNISNILQRFLTRNSLGYGPAIGVLVIFCLLSLVSREGRIFNVMLISFSALVLLYFYWINRVVYRVEYGIFLGTAAGMISGIPGLKKNGGQAKRALCFICAALLLGHAVVWIPDQNSKQMTNAEYRSYRNDVCTSSGSFKQIKYWANVNDRQAYPNLAKLVETDTEHYYLFDFNTTIQLTYFDYKPWLRTKTGLYDRFSYFGGITSYYPENQTMWEKHGIDSRNPMKSIVNENILVVDSKNHDAKLQYLRKYYYPKARKDYHSGWLPDLEIL